MRTAKSGFSSPVGLSASLAVLCCMLVPVAQAYDLCTCNHLTCPAPEHCAHGTVPDQCGCCMVCARGVHEPCGGGPEGPGVCGLGLQCVIDARPGDLVTGNEQGTCQEIAADCDASACDSIATHRCPSDSVLVYNSTEEETACCRTTYECRCNPAACKVPKCFAGHTPQILRHSNQRPGSCCDLYQCQPLGCLSEGVVYKNNATWREGDCVMCHCVGGRKQCQAEMCVKTCHNPVYVPGRCCPSCETPSVYPDQSSDSCPSLDMCNITCHSGLRQTPDGCHVCKCRPRLCFQDCRYGYIFDEFGQETCDCHAIPPSCPALDACSKDCNHGYRASKKGCPKCRCNKCSPLNCSRKCSHGYQTDRFGCEVCKCQELLWERNCTVNITEYRPGQLWTTEDCHSCRCTHDGSVTCQPVMCPVQTCLFMVNRAEECCPVCLNVSITHVSSKGQPTDRHEEQTTHMTSTSKGVDHAALADMERKYVISLAAVGTLMMILLILVFVLLYLKLKQRHQASWSVAGQDTYCKCPLFIGHSPTLQHKYNINTDLHPVGKIGFETPIMRKFEKTFIDTALKSDSTPEERKSFIEKDNGADEHEHKNVKDFINEDDGVENIESKCKYKDWADV
ncbi:cysteine-rich motor neuron 1 protein-like [Mya arenaria]|uniref:cysteine-rich motor neuron 1 protein-like n=1 Tax=Mya arenaria TaxID=6604 RepID=UPI0022E47389|nr:cysteine-rich motor neuron 1 protein-like [Mya arenaria]